ncbi:hypothetical protein GJ496_000966 [Pomphorhynchus laevis]|nr:hypothetical protein GJ496_000966 [Pomphorhynchus laevis]
MPITKDKSVDAQFEQTILLEFDKIMITSGSTVDIDNTVKCPIISTVIPTNKYHTLILIDLGENLKSNKQICDQKKRTFVNSNPISAMKQTFALHWLIVNITYYSSGHEVKSYMGPQKSGHCYGLFFYEQDNKQNIDSKSYIGCSNRSKPYLFRFCKYTVAVLKQQKTARSIINLQYKFKATLNDVILLNGFL